METGILQKLINIQDAYISIIVLFMKQEAWKNASKVRFMSVAGFRKNLLINGIQSRIRKKMRQ